MDLATWLPSTLTVAILGVAAWLARKLIITRLTAAVQHEFNAKLERLQSELRQNEEQFANDLRQRDAQLAALREAAIAASTSRHVELDKRRIVAVEQIWGAVTRLAPARVASRFLASIRLEEVAKSIAHDSKLREFINLPFLRFDVKTARLDTAAEARPFVTPLVWALFSAFVSFVTHAVMVRDAVDGGMDLKLFLHEPMRRLLATTLPHRASELTAHPTHNEYDAFIDEMQERMLQEVQRMLEGRGDDLDRVHQAAAILKAAEEAHAAIAPDPRRPPATA